MAKREVTTRLEKVRRKHRIEHELKGIENQLFCGSPLENWKAVDLKKNHKKLSIEKRVIEKELGHT